MSTHAMAFESFESYQAGEVLDGATGVTNMVSVDQCTDGEKSLKANYDSSNQWNQLKIELANSVDASASTHIAFDAINDSGVPAQLLIKLVDSNNSDAWHWMTVDQSGAAAYAIDLSYIDGNNSGSIDFSDISVIDFGNAASADGAEIYIDNLRLSGATPTVGAGCNAPTPPVTPPTDTGELRTEGGSLGSFGVLLMSALIWLRRRR
jgi:hypothetical protein